MRAARVLQIRLRLLRAYPLRRVAALQERLEQIASDASGTMQQLVVQSQPHRFHLRGAAR